MSWETVLQGSKNAVFLGEAGCGKSELAMDLAVSLGAGAHFFDMDQTKPLLRARDVRRTLEAAGVAVHYEAQTADAPTQVGGVAPLMADPAARVVMDAGGGAAGARLIGGFAHLLRRSDTAVFYVVNPYRPWSGDIISIDETLSAVLRAARIRQVRYLLNPTLGPETTAEEFCRGLRTGLELLSPYVAVEAAAVSRLLIDKLKDDTPLPLLPITPRLPSLWEGDYRVSSGGDT